MGFPSWKSRDVLQLHTQLFQGIPVHAQLNPASISPPSRLLVLRGNYSSELFQYISLTNSLCFSGLNHREKYLCFCYRAASPQGHSTKSCDCMAVSWDIIQVPGTLLLQINHLLIKILYLHRHWMLSKTALNLESGQFIHRFSGYVRAQHMFLGNDWDF